MKRLSSVLSLLGSLFTYLYAKTATKSCSEAWRETWGTVMMMMRWWCRQFDVEPPKQRKRHTLELQQCHFFPQTHPYPRLKNRILERILRAKKSFLQPPLWPKLKAIRTPYLLQTPHRVGMVSNPSSSLHKSPIRQHIIF